MGIFIVTLEPRHIYVLLNTLADKSVINWELVLMGTVVKNGDGVLVGQSGWVVLSMTSQSQNKQL